VIFSVGLFLVSWFRVQKAYADFIRLDQNVSNVFMTASDGRLLGRLPLLESTIETDCFRKFVVGEFQDHLVENPWAVEPFRLPRNPQRNMLRIRTHSFVFP
jgi:hypothetical protein